MAGHNFSRYMSNFWSALFAPFRLPLFTRIWCFFTQILAREKEHISSLPSPKSPASPASISNSSRASSSSPSPHKSEQTSPTAAHNHPSSVLSALLHAQSSSHWIAGDSSLSQHPNDNPDVDASYTDTNDATDSLAHDYHQHQQSIDMAKKRNSRGRGGARSSINPPMTVTPAIPVIPAADTVKDWPASTSQSENIASGHTSFIMSHTSSPECTSFGHGDGQTRDCNSSIPQQQSGDYRKENAAPPEHNDSQSRIARLDSMVPMPLAVMNNRSEPQKPGTRSYPTVGPLNTDSALDNMGDKGPKASSGDEQLHVLANRLNLDDGLSPRQPSQHTLIEATTGAEVANLPVPLVVTVPLLPQLQIEQSRSESPPPSNLPGLIEPTTDEERAEREYHLKFMREALDMGDLALKTNETPVGCVLVYQGRVIAKGMNATNITRNGTRHAEFMALSALLSRRDFGDVPATINNTVFDDASWDAVEPKDGHIYPYGQKLHPASVVDRSIITECVLYVTVEPCVMCASLLRQLGIKKVYFGAVNDKFGGTGGVFRVHMNSKPVTLPKGRPYQQGYGPQELHLISKGRAVALPRDEDDGDGGNVEPGYPVEGGYLRDDAVSLLRRFYVQENGRAPQPRKKEGRAARLYAALEIQNRPANASDLSDNTPETPVEADAPMVLDSKSDPTISVVCV